MSREGRRAETGQATVEAALTLPVVLLVLLLIVQVGLVVRDVLALDLAAREGAREAAVSADDERAEAAVRRAAAALEVDRITIQIDPPGTQRTRGGPVTVRLGYSVRVRIPLVDRVFSGEVPLRSVVVMRSERAGATPSPTPTPEPSPEPEPSPSPEPEP